MRITNRQLFLLWAVIGLIIALASVTHAEECPEPIFQPIYGRVTDAYGRAVSRARIEVHVYQPVPHHFPMYYSQTNAFGYYRIPNVYHCEPYIVLVDHRRVQFLPAYEVLVPWYWQGDGLQRC